MGKKHPNTIEVRGKAEEFSLKNQNKFWHMLDKAGGDIDEASEK